MRLFFRNPASSGDALPIQLYPEGFAVVLLSHSKYGADPPSIDVKVTSGLSQGCSDIKCVSNDG